ncbi:MAG: CsbD family protein [Candidatus Riflebacteria bacterium]|nr:CsbD family protein [Candidatus Riflebacteria bacterium]
MNWDQIEGNWKQMMGHVRAKWGKFTNDDLELMAGKKDVLSGQLQERYGFAKHIAERELDSFARNLKHPDFAEAKVEKKAGD